MTATTPGEAGPLDLLRDERKRHWEQHGDYRTAYRRVCAVCSVTRSQPYYNELQSWREAEDWPCATSVALDAAIAALADRGAALDQARRDGAVEALREAADEWPGLYYAPSVPVWLRARAAALAEQGDGE